MFQVFGEEGFLRHLLHHSIRQANRVAGLNGTSQQVDWALFEISGISRSTDVDSIVGNLAIARWAGSYSRKWSSQQVDLAITRWAGSYSRR